MPFWGMDHRLLLSVLLVVNLVADPWIDEICHRPPIDRYRGQWIELVNPDGAPIDCARLTLACAGRMKRLVPWPGSGAPGGGAGVAGLPAQSRSLILDRGMNEAVAPKIPGVPVLTTDSESLADGSFLASGDELRLLLDGREIDRVVLGETPPRRSWVRLFRDAGQASDVWASSLGPATPGAASVESTAYGEDAPSKLFWNGAPALLVLGRPVVGDFRLVDPKGRIARQWGRPLTLCRSERFPLVPLDGLGEKSADGTRVTLPFQLGRSPLLVACPDRLGFFQVEEAVRGPWGVVPGWVGPFDSPLAKTMWVNEVRSCEGNEVPYVELAGANPFRGSFSIELWSDDLKSSRRFAFEIPTNAFAWVLAPVPLASPSTGVIDGFRPYAEGRIVLLDDQDQVIDVAVTRKSAWGLVDGDSLHRLDPKRPALARDHWVPSSPLWPPSPGTVGAMAPSGLVDLILLRNLVSRGDLGEIARIFPRVAIEMALELWSLDGRTCIPVLSTTAMAPGQAYSLSLGQLHDRGFDPTGLFALRLVARRLPGGAPEVLRRCLEFKP
ncbi:MAG: hypothetical protein J0L75_14495 [Spirochaetes bacterium]|nr:hypothetical protein [Spirochaetota bacterium]